MQRDKVGGQKKTLRWRTWLSSPSDHGTIFPMGSVVCCWRNHSTSSSGRKHMGLRWCSVRKPVGRWGRVQQGIDSTWNPACPSALDSNTKTFSHHIPIEMMEIQTSLKKQPSLKFLFKFYLTLPLQVPFPREYFFNMKKIIFFNSYSYLYLFPSKTDVSKLSFQQLKDYLTELTFASVSFMLLVIKNRTQM